MEHSVQTLAGIRVSESVCPGPAASAQPGSLLEMQILLPPSLDLGPEICDLPSSPDDYCRRTAIGGSSEFPPSHERGIGLVWEVCGLYAGTSCKQNGPSGVNEVTEFLADASLC